MRSIERTMMTLTLVSVLIPGLGRPGWSQERTASAKSGTGHLIWGEVGVPGVTLQGLPGAPVTDETGRYRARVPLNWSGTVTPTKPGYRFEPPTRQYSVVQKDWLNEDYVASVLTYTITGSVGLSGVTMKGLPANVVTDPDGKYVAQVEYGWSGTVTPTKQGYEFAPPAREYSSVRGDPANQDYAARVLTFTISGSAGIPGVVMEGLPGEPVTDEQGKYQAKVEYGWSGIVTPKKEGYEFAPRQRDYATVVQNAKDNYKAKALRFELSGNADVAGVTMKGLPGDPVTDTQGNYRASLPYGWSATVTPTKEGYVFEPPQCEYSAVTGPVTSQDYHARVLMFQISGSAGLPGVILRGLPGDVMSDENGYYSARVPYGWSGTVTPVLAGSPIAWEPPSRSYMKVIADLAGQDYVALDYTPARPAPGGAPYGALTPSILVIPTRTADPKAFAELQEDMQVMLNILREKLSEPRMIMGTLVDYGDFFSGGRGTEALYLQGCGVIFVMRVDFPLAPAAGPKDQNEPDQKEPADPVWQKAREKLYAPAGSTRYGGPRAAGGPQGMSFEQFRDDLLKTFKHAANIRNIEPNEMVILTVVGQSQEPAVIDQAGGRGSYSLGGGWVEGGSYGTSGSSFGTGGGSSYADSRTYSRGAGLGPGRSGRMRTGAAPAPTTFLTIYAQKLDVDAFAKGTLSFERFQQRVKMLTY